MKSLVKFKKKKKRNKDSQETLARSIEKRYTRSSAKINVKTKNVIKNENNLKKKN